MLLKFKAFVLCKQIEKRKTLKNSIFIKKKEKRKVNLVPYLNNNNNNSKKDEIRFSLNEISLNLFNLFLSVLTTKKNLKKQNNLNDEKKNKKLSYNKYFSFHFFLSLIFILCKNDFSFYCCFFPFTYVLKGNLLRKQNYI